MTPSEAAIALVDVMKRLEDYEAKLKQAKEDVVTFKEFLKVSKELRDEYKAILFPARVRKPKEKPEAKKRGRRLGSKNKVKDTSLPTEVPQTTSGEAQRPSANDIGYVGDMICPTEKERRSGNATKVLPGEVTELWAPELTGDIVNGPDFGVKVSYTPDGEGCAGEVDTQGSVLSDLLQIQSDSACLRNSLPTPSLFPSEAEIRASATCQVCGALLKDCHHADHIRMQEPLPKGFEG